MQRESVASAAPVLAETRRFDPMSTEPRDPPDRTTTGAAMMRFASRRPHPDQTVESAWAPTETDEAEAALR